MYNNCTMYMFMVQVLRPEIFLHYLLLKSGNFSSTVAKIYRLPLLPPYGSVYAPIFVGPPPPHPALFMPLYLWGLPPPSCQGPRVRGVITGQSSLPQNMPKNTNYISHMNSLSFSLFLTTFWLHALILQLHLSHSLSSSLIFYLLIFSPIRSGNLLYLIFLILF